MLRAILCGGVWNVVLLEKARDADVPCRFCGGKDGDGHLFWECTFPPIPHVRELPEFMPLMGRDRGNWPRCLLWHGWLPGLSLAVERNPWAASLGLLADRVLEQRLGAYPADGSGLWTPPDYWDAEDLALGMEDHPCVWTDGSREDSPTGGFGVAGAGVYLPATEEIFRDAVWGTPEEYGDARLNRFYAGSGFSSDGPTC